MTNKHPITPPFELVKQYWDEPQFGGCFAEEFATFFARWGADQELEACIEWVRSMFGGHPTWAEELRAARRPKPPSLKEQALESVRRFESGQDLMGDLNTIRRALEALPND
jgi:hypothetical protein